MNFDTAENLLIEGVKYERIEGDEFEMRRFEEEEILSYLNNRLEVKKSIFDAVVYDSEIERKFAERLDEREDIRLFVKLPWWFRIETPIGDYNPDWAIVKHDSSVLFLLYTLWPMTTWKLSITDRSTIARRLILRWRAS